MKNESNSPKKEEKEDGLERILDYKLTIDFSKLINELRESKRIGQENGEDIGKLRGAIQSFREDREGMQHKLMECSTSLDQTTLTISHYNEKIIQLETLISKNTKDVTTSFQQMHESSNAKANERQEAFEGKVNKNLKILEDKFNRLLGIEVSSKDPEKTAFEIELEEKLEKLEHSVSKDMSELRDTYETKIYNLESKIEELSANMLPATKSQGAESFEKSFHALNSHDFNTLALNKDSRISSDLANELYRQYKFLIDQIERQKKAIIEGYKTGSEEELKTNYVSYKTRIDEIEDSNSRLQDEVEELMKKQSLIISSLKQMQKIFAEKLKLKISLGGLGDDEENVKKGPSFSRESVGPKASKLYHPSAITVDSMDLSGIQKQIHLLALEIEKCTTKEAFDKLDQNVRTQQVIIATKADKKELESFEAKNEGSLKKISDKLMALLEFKEISEKGLAELGTGAAARQKVIEDQNEKLQKLEEIISKMSFSLTDIAHRIEQRASSTDVSILRQSMNETTERIEKLCALLEDIDQEDPSKSSEKSPKKENIKFMIFRVEQRVEELEKRLEIMQTVAVDEVLDEAKQELPLTSSKDLSSIEGSPLKFSRAEAPGLRGAVSRHEILLNEMSLRLSEVEEGMQKLEPNSIRRLIKDISEIVINENQKEVTEEMSNIKGSQKHSALLVEKLNEELKKMDERFHENIDKKIERKDLNTAKNQLRRKLMDLEHKMRGKDSSLNGSRSQAFLDPFPMMMYNSKCFFCNQEVKLSPEVLQLCDVRHLVQNSSIKEAANKTARYGPGYSHVLSSLREREPEEYEIVFPRTKLYSDDSIKRRGLKSSVPRRKNRAVDIPGNASGIRLAPLSPLEKRP